MVLKWTAPLPDWRTILVGGFNSGGRGFYALDITDPATPKALWEFTPASKFVGDVSFDADVSSNTEFLVPAILFQSTKQASKLLLQVSGFYLGTYNYQTEYYGTGLPKKMTANVITETGAFWAREAYYYSYGR